MRKNSPEAALALFSPTRSQSAATFPVTAVPIKALASLKSLRWRLLCCAAPRSLSPPPYAKRRRRAKPIKDWSENPMGYTSNGQGPSGSPAQPRIDTGLATLPLPMPMLRTADARSLKLLLAVAHTSFRGAKNPPSSPPLARWVYSSSRAAGRFSLPCRLSPSSPLPRFLTNGTDKPPRWIPSFLLG